MERIKQAVERARAERLSQRDARGGIEQPVPANQAGTARNESSLKLRPRSVTVSWPSLYENRIIGGPEASSLVDSYRVLRTRVLQRLATHEARTLGVTSANQGEGKSLTAINLAISIAKKAAVLLIDADLRRPSIQQLFGLDSTAGLTEYLAGSSNLEECLFSPGVEGLVVLPGGASTENSSEVLVSPAMIGLIESLKRADPGMLIIFDLPPLLTTDDTLAFAPHLDAMLMVVEEGRTVPSDLERAIELIKDTVFLGTVLNKSSQTRQPYY